MAMGTSAAAGSEISRRAKTYAVIIATLPISGRTTRPSCLKNWVLVWLGD